MAKKVLVLMGSDSDFPVMSKCIDVFREFGVEFEMNAYSAHRSPSQVEELSKNAISNNVGVIIAAAGKAAHLAGVVAANTTLPVIGVPIKTSMAGGLDSLLSMVQMPQGVPVATVAVDGAYNAALLAIQILAVSDSGLSDKLLDDKKKMTNKVVQNNEKLQKEIENYAKG